MKKKLRYAIKKYKNQAGMNLTLLLLRRTVISLIIILIIIKDALISVTLNI